MTIQTLQDLCYAYSVAEPVREMLFALQDRITELEAQRKPLTGDEVWKNNKLMSLNAELGCSMELLMEVVEAIEAAHGIKESI